MRWRIKLKNPIFQNPIKNGIFFWVGKHPNLSTVPFLCRHCKQLHALYSNRIAFWQDFFSLLTKNLTKNIDLVYSMRRLKNESKSNFDKKISKLIVKFWRNNFIWINNQILKKNLIFRQKKTIFDKKINW